MTNLVILDPSLASFNGHFLTYDNAVAEGAKKHGFKSLFFASQNVDVTLPVAGELVPTFRYGLEHDAISSRFIPGRFVARVNRHILQKGFLDDMMQHVTPDRIGANPVMYLHTTTHNQIAPLVDWVVRNRHLSPVVVIMLRYAMSPNPYYPRSAGTAGYKKALQYITDRGAEKNIRLVTDSQILADEYRLITALPIHVLPIPHTAHAWAPNPQDTPPLLSYLGNARATKGFQYLPHVVDSIRDMLDKDEWRAEFQANVMFGRDTESLQAVQLLRQRNVVLREQEMSIDDYNSLLQRSSLVVIPYQLLYYYAQTSGVMCEALAAGRPVVVPRGTWMSQQIGKLNVGETFLPGDRLSLADAVRRAMNNLATLKKNAENYRAEWVCYHSPDNFMLELLKVI